MSDTPRTDAAEHRVNYIGEEGECDYMAVTSDVARQLERDLAAEKKAWDNLLAHNQEIVGALTQKLAEARGVIELVREYPDFDSGEGPMAEAMDAVLRDETPKVLIDIAHLRAGLKPPVAP